jgi:N-acetylneuraminic acid mutarotase
MLLLAVACRDKGLEKLEFLEVATESPVLLDIGTVQVVGRISGLAQSNVDQCGFIWSYNSDSVSTPEQSLRRIIVNTQPAGNDSFSVFFRINPTETVYFRAFAQLGDRLVYAKEIVSSSLDVIVEMAGTATVENNSATVYGALIGLKVLDQTLSYYGHVFSESNQTPEIGAPDCDSTQYLDANQDGLFESPLKALKFNTTYYVRAYAIDGQQQPIYSTQIDTFRIRDGWERIADFPTPLQDGAAIAAANGFAYAGFGINNTGGPPTDIIKELWRFDPNDPSNWAKTPSEPFNNELTYKRTNTSLFSINDTIYVIFGEQDNPNPDPNPIANRNFWKYSISSDQWVNTPISPSFPFAIFSPRSGAAGFVLNGKIYVGAGVFYPANGYIYKNDFWEYDPATGNWRQVKSLPMQNSNNSINNYGRSDAISFASANNGYVGCGEYLGLPVNDFWKFTPPTSLQDSGKWELVTAQFPGLGRINGVAFVIGNKAFVGTGWNLSERNLADFYAFDFTSETWSKQTAFQGSPRQRMIGFSLNGYGYAGTGIARVADPNGQIFYDEVQRDFWRYTPEQ